MNFLAHFLLAHPTSASRAGNFLGDFITGTPESLSQIVPVEVLDGIMMHRHIDAYTDSHPSFLEGKLLLAPEQRRFAGIILDIFTDHFLSLEWDRYSDTPLVDFTRQVESDLREHWEAFPEDARQMADRMFEDDWFSKYQTVEGIQLTLAGLSQSRPKFDPIAGAIEEFREHYDTFRVLSHRLLGEALEQSW